MYTFISQTIYLTIFNIERIHTKNKSEKCDKCGKIFVDPSALRKHIIRFHKNEVNIKEYQCKQCLKRFSEENYLSIHLKTHGKKNKKKNMVKCDKCNLKLCKTSLKRHIRRKHS